MKIQAYKSIKLPNEFELKEKKSIFLAKVYYVNNEDEVNQFLGDVKKKYSDASHRCYAYKLVNGKTKFSDAGEPSGTAGIRILNAIDHYKIQNCLLVVIRYFGGTKLGVGPLGKAYYSAAINVLSKSEIIVIRPYRLTKMQVNIEKVNKLIGFLHSNKIKILETEYDSEVKINCLFPIDSYKSLHNKIISTFREGISIIVKDEIIFD